MNESEKENLKLKYESLKKSVIEINNYSLKPTYGEKPKAMLVGDLVEIIVMRLYEIVERENEKRALKIIEAIKTKTDFENMVNGAKGA